MEKQIDFISICKGIGIILVVLGHLNIGEYWHQVIYSFHMPLFFFISGYLFKNIYLEIPKEFLLKKAKTLYIPFVKWALIFLLLHNVFVYFHIEKGMYDIKDYLIGGANILLFCNKEPVRLQRNRRFPLYRYVLQNSYHFHLSSFLLFRIALYFFLILLIKHL